VVVAHVVGLVSDARCDGHHKMVDSGGGDGKQLPAQRGDGAKCTRIFA